MNLIRAFSLFSVSISFVALSSAQVVAGQTDNFQDGTLMGWSGGASLQNIATGGPGGAGDRFLQVQSFGGFGGGSRLATFNGTQWKGNYQAAGVTAISIQMRNLGATALQIRLVLFDLDGTDERWTSTVSQSLPVGGGWQTMTFSVAQADLTRVQGTGTYANLIIDVDRIMFRHQSGAPDSEGDAIAATAGMDNITALGPVAQIVNPQAYTVVEGTEPIHNLPALLLSDDVRLEVRSNTINSNTSVVEYFTTAPAMTVNRLSFILECHSNDASRQRNIDLWNFTTGAWEPVSSSVGTVFDSTVQVNITVNPGRFIDGATREMRARTRLISATLPRTWPRVVDFMDRAVWELSN